MSKVAQRAEYGTGEFGGQETLDGVHCLLGISLKEGLGRTVSQLISFWVGDRVRLPPMQSWILLLKELVQRAWERV